MIYKKVNIYPTMPITGVNPPIRSVVKNVTKSDKEIRACIMARAKVEEILKDGSLINIDLTNYDKDNNVEKVKEEVPEVEVINVVPEIVEDVAPVAEPLVEAEPEVEDKIEEDVAPVVESEAEVVEPLVKDEVKVDTDTEVEAAPEVAPQQNNTKPQYNNNKYNGNKKRNK